MKFLPYILFVFISVLLTSIFFKGLSSDQFLYLQDEYLPLSQFEINTAFSTIDQTDLGYPNTIIMLITFFDRVFYSVANRFEFNLLTTQIIFYFLKLLLIQTLPYIGFKLLSKLADYRPNMLLTFAISMWYSFNTFTLIYWHGNAFGFNLLLCYALAPATFYVFNKAVLQKSSILIKLFFCVCVYLMSFGIYLFAVFVIFLLVYTILQLIKDRNLVLLVAKNVGLIFILYLPFLGNYILIAREIYASIGATVNSVGGETSGNLQGGVLYQIFMWHSWAIYTLWTPRNIYSFYGYFYSIPSLIAPIGMYFIIIGTFLRKGFNPTTVKLFIVLALFLIFVKGPQEPLGGFYKFLMETIPFFRVFRSPDNKFGFGLILLLSLILSSQGKLLGKKIAIIILLISFIQSWPLLSGIAIRGENSEKSSDRVLKLDNDQDELISFINSNAQPFGYIFAFPSEGFNHYTYESKQSYIGQDLIAKYSNLPFINYSESSGMNMNTFNLVQKTVKDSNLDNLSSLPIKYFLVRSDNSRQVADSKISDKLHKEYRLVFENKVYKLYFNSQYKPVVLGPRNMRFLKVSPTNYMLSLKDVDFKNDATIELLNNKSTNWTMFTYDKEFVCAKDYIHKGQISECVGTPENFINFSDVKYLYTRPEYLLKTQTNNEIFSNAWNIVDKDVKTKSAVMLYMPQVYFYLSQTTAFMYIIVIALVFVGYKLYPLKRYI